MKISTRGRYGVRAMMELAGGYGKGPMLLAEIARTQGISRKYLEQIFAELRKAGMVRGIRGASGGYELGRAPDQIKLGDIIRSLEGPMEPVECVGGEVTCTRAGKCAAQSFWSELAQAMEKVLDSKTLEDLVLAQRGLNQANCSMYYI